MYIEKLDTAYRSLNAAISASNAPAIVDRQDEVKQLLEAIAKSAGLKGVLKVDAKWAAHIVKQKDLEVSRKNQETAVSRIKAIASKITGSESFQDPNVKQEIADLSGTDAKKLKEIVAAMNYKVTAKKSDAIIIELLEKITGTSSVQIDQALVLTHVQKLKALYDKSINSLPEVEIKAELKQLKALPIAELVQVAEDFGLEKPGKTKTAIVKRVETKLKATYKAKVDNQV